MFLKIGKPYQFAGLLVLMLNIGCNDSSEKSLPTPAVLIDRPIDTIFSGGRDTIIFLKEGKAILKGHINSHKARLMYTLPVWKQQTVTLLLKPLTKGGNIRINQVQKPGGEFDGPYGDSLQSTMEDNGNFCIIIGQNLMAEGLFTGDFVLHVIVK